MCVVPHLWEDEEGVVHEIPQGEGGEQGDPSERVIHNDHGRIHSRKT